MYQGRMRNSGILKSGHLYISAKGIGWKTWKRRWFVLTRTSLVFFKAEPKGQIDFSMPLGGIYLNNSGSVHQKMEKKLLSVVFPDMRMVTLKAESSEDLEEWRQSLEKALILAPEVSMVADSGGFIPTENIDGLEIGRDGDGKDKRPLKSMVVGRPVLLALEELDGTPSFLEKALCFVETHGLMVEGILRQSADVEDVERRVKEYEQGRNMFTPGEDAHVIADCVKHVLRELPSSPVPKQCCVALLAAHRLDEREQRIEAMKIAVADTFPEPNRILLQRVLKMMIKVSSQSAVNRMTKPAVAACMAPLLLRPLLAGDCTADDDSDDSGDGSSSLIAATAAANQANAIVTLMMEEYERVFPEEIQPKALQCEDHSVDSDDDGPSLRDRCNEPVSSTLSDTSTSGAQDGSEVPSDLSDSMAFANAVIAEEEAQLRQLQIIKEEMEMKLKNEEMSNEILRASLDSRKQALREQRLIYEEDIASLQDKLHRQREIKAALESNIGAAVMNGGNIDSRLQEDLAEISELEADVARLKSRVAELQELMEHERLGRHMNSTERQERKISLMKLRAQLEEELERTMALCNEEKAKNAQFEEQYHQEEEAALERLVIQQRQALSEAQVSERSAVPGRTETDGKEKHGTSHNALTVAAVFVSLFKKKLLVANNAK